MKTTTQHLKSEFNKTYKSMNRFYTLYFYNTFKSKSFSKWQRISKNIQNKIKEKEIVHQYVAKLYLNNSSVSDKKIQEQKEEKKEETKILKNEYKLNYDGFTSINKELNNRIDYSFTDGYQHVIIRRYFADTNEFINENKYQGYLYKNSLKTYNSLKEIKGK